jgi:hypothetical protein
VTGGAPSAALLLALARETLLRDVLPALPEERRLAGLMIAQALAIAEREGAAAAEAPDIAPLAAAIRAGAYDAPGREREAARQRLRTMAKEALRIANPKLLAAEGLD